MKDSLKTKIEYIFKQYRKHKYYTLFMSDVNVSITSHIDEIGGGRSNQTSDQTANAAVKLADKKQEAREYVDKVEQAVEQLPDIEKELIQQRYMSRNHDYITDYTVYETKLYVSAPHYHKIRNRAFKKLIVVLDRVL